MEISSAIHTSVNTVQLPFFSNIHSPSKLNYPLHNSPSFLHSRPSIPLKWRQQLSTTRSLSDDTAASCMKSAMKNRVGEILAESLKYYYFDSDNVVEEAAGKDSSGKSLKERDEDSFRESETEVLKQLSSMGRLVVNAGNGAVQGSTNLGLLRHGIAIWIDVPLDMIAKELIGDEDQSSMSNISTPDSFSEALARLAQLYEENRGGYAIADVTLSLEKVASKWGYDELEQVTAEEVALEALGEIEKLTRVKKMMEQAGTPF
ncbi:hypothetical protein KSS87_003628 [Heliosperma pusillum]|nr:hypothetical protein KSS87_003628 [Heliosperma pusillum]